MNKHSFFPNGHDNKIFDKFCKVSSVFDKGELLDIIVQNWCDDQDIECITQSLIDRLYENGFDENGNEIDDSIILPKGTELEWKSNNKPYYVAKAGAKAILTEDYTTKDDFVKVEFIDELANGQNNGGYYREMFKKSLDN